MFTRKLVGLTALALLLVLVPSAWAAQTTYVAQLTAQRGDQLATGRAMWLSQDGIVTLTVFADEVQSTDALTVFIDGRFVGAFDIVDGSGSLVMTEQGAAIQVPQVVPGSKIMLYAGDTDRPVLYGWFRTK